MLCKKCFMELPRFQCPSCGYDNTRAIVADKWFTIVGIAGPMGSGKSTMGKLLMDSFQGDNRVIPFAKPVKDIATLMGWDGEKDDKGRRLLQLIGTECGRECIDPDIWINRWRDMVMKQSPCTLKSIIVADDLRFPNELEIIKSMGGVCIKIVGRNEIEATHKSEEGLPSELFDKIYHNDRPISDMFNFAKGFANKKLGGLV